MDIFYGALVGDMVGSVYEFHNIKTKDFPFWDSACFATDDSIMTLAIAKALMDAVEEGCFDTLTDDEWRRRFRDNMREVGKPFPGCGYGGRFFEWMYSDDPKPYHSYGNGSAMRVSPVAWFARSLEECERLARLTAEPTHDHPDGVAGAQATAGAVYLARHGADKAAIKAYVEKYYTIDFTLDEIRDTYTFNEISAGTVPYAVEAFLESDSFDDCIRNTISIGGDSDTLAAVSGAIAEAYYGTPKLYYGTVINRLNRWSPGLCAILNRLERIEVRK